MHAPGIGNNKADQCYLINNARVYPVQHQYRTDSGTLDNYRQNETSMIHHKHKYIWDLLVYSHMKS